MIDLHNSDNHVVLELSTSGSLQTVMHDIEAELTSFLGPRKFHLHYAIGSPNWELVTPIRSARRNCIRVTLKSLSKSLNEQVAIVLKMKFSQYV